MEIVFADSFYFIALIHQADKHHEDAVAASTGRHAILLTTDYALVEVADALASTRHRKDVADYVRFLRSASWIDVVAADRELFDSGMQLYTRRRDKHWSLTDCISFHVMDARGITKALTHDHHFKQAGFQILL